MARRLPMESTLVGCLFAAAPTGIFYGFALYSESLRVHSHLSDGDLLNVATLPYLLGFTSAFWGFVAHRLGPRVGLFVAGIATCGGQIAMYLIARGTWVLGPPQVSLVACMCISYIGVQCFTSVAFSLPVLSYQRLRSKALSIVKSFVGLSGAAVAQLFWLLIGHRPGIGKSSLECLDGILIWAVVAAISCLIGICLIPAVTTAGDPAHESEQRLNSLWWMCLVWALCVACSSVVTLEAVHFVLAVVLLAAVALPLVFLAVWWRNGPQSSLVHTEAQFEALESRDFKQMLSSPEAWCLLLTSTAVIGSGQFLSSSMSQILSAAGNASNDAIVLAQTLYSAGNMLGRLTCTIPSDVMVRVGISRPYFCVAILGTMALSQMLFMVLPHFPQSAALIAIGSLLGGYAFGAIWPHLVLICSELFGSQYLSTNYMFYDGACGCLGTVIFARVLAGSLYQAQAHGSKNCAGSACFYLTHVICVCSCGVGAVSACAMGIRSTSLYRAMRQSSASSSLLATHRTGAVCDLPLQEEELTPPAKAQQAQ